MRQVTIEVFDCKADKERPKNGNCFFVRYVYSWYKALYYKTSDSVLCEEVQKDGRVPFTEFKEWYNTITPAPLNYKNNGTTQ